MNDIVKFKGYKNNKYIINDNDVYIIYELFDNKASKIISKRKLERLIYRLDKYHINYQIDGKIKIFKDNKYMEYKIKHEKKKKLCSYIEDNILSKKMNKILKEIEIIIDE